MVFTETTDEYFLCPHCGAELPLQATFCRECGSSNESGWSQPLGDDIIQYRGEEEFAEDDGFDEDAFDYDEFVRSEFPDHARARDPGITGLQVVVWILLGLVALGLFLSF